MMETPKRAPKKGLKGFLLVEFRKDALLTRLRFKVLLTLSGYGIRGYGIQITKSGSKWLKGILKHNRVVIGDRVSERQLFETMAEYISAKEKIPIASIAFRWENRSFRLPKK
jgi:hypothetical protein